ncbi:nickel ABC transporter permease subunit NikC [Paenibacillus chitinolyticus]|uniref:ABC transporter permease subunit n=1 Tax=Paenibacillus chitinolyticus TaxID=79263 RepID=A0A410WXY0_9BACL|nr:ABC transporter permease subunit [Paenibacillus chitinolyticus]MCY9589897.1 ABC transporter permease subunit [Paenibacillus chitinolyticus]MCY9596234.1 ABC transporter permease subunit [Paenibacillus chitinolyticus]QAV19268.1 nickel ABC transporter permease subunit NikC [Paenibacillus chitinolyticus]
MVNIRNLIWATSRQRILFICLFFLSVIVLAGLFAPLLAPHDPNFVDLANKLKGPSAEYPLGTDHMGRCVLSRLLYGTRVSLSLALLIVSFCLLIGLVIGSLAGYAGGKLDSLIMRCCDAILAIPALILAISLIAIWGAGWKQMAIALIVVQSVYYARFIRGLVFNLKKQTFIVAARVSGTSPWRMIVRHIIPNLLPPLLTVVTLEIGWVIMDISALSFIGLGVQSPTPEWGAMINEGKSFIGTHPRLMIAPGFIIFCMVALLNLLGEAFNDKKGLVRSFRKGGAR